MSKTRTGRKGRARLAVAAHLEAIGESDRTAADDLDSAALLDRLNALAKGQGTGGQLFSQGQVLGALPDSVDTTDGAPGIFANAAQLVAAEMAGVAGETTLAADADFPQLAGPFPHYYMTAAGTTSTSSRGIAYLPSGPAADFIPANHGLSVDDTLTLTINVDQSELYAVGTDANLGISAIGTMLAADTLSGSVSTHTQATAIFKLSNGSNVDGDDDISFITEARGAEIRIADSDDDSTLLNIKFRASGYNQDGLGVADIDSAAVGAAAGDAILYNVDSETQVSVIEAGVVGGVNDSAVALVANIVAAINAWRAEYGDMISVAPFGNQLTVTMNKLRGASGNALVDQPLKGCTITALVTKFGAQQPVDKLDKEEQWFLNAVDGDIRHIAFASGETDVGPPFAFGDVPPVGAQLPDNAGVDVLLRYEQGKYASADIQLVYTVKTNATSKRDGLVIAWSLTPA